MTEISFYKNKLSCHLRIPLLALIASVALGVANGANEESLHAGHKEAVDAKLVQAVKTATERFIDVNAATSQGYQPAFGCVSGPDHGAMGVHYISGALVMDGEVDAARPEALIYEPTKT